MTKSPLEMDDGIGEDLNAAMKGAAEEEHGQPPLETPFQEEAPPPSLIWMNLNDNPDLVRDRIFEAVVAGDPELLNGLSDYLQRTSSFLTDPEYRDGQNPTIPELLRIDKETRNPKPLVNAACTDSYYEALHIAIEKRNYKFVNLLVDNGADVHAKASGFLFQQDYKEAHFYFEVVMYLLDNPHQKARLKEQDSMGNTVLHALVMVANNTKKNTELVVNMYDRILMKGILKHMLQREMNERKFQHLSRKFIEWTYGPIQSSLYDLTSIDSCEENSMLETLAYNSDVPVSRSSQGWSFSGSSLPCDSFI
ncbi:Transient receptor potential cation channel subfamily V member 2, partial [Ophiophagus hannah]